MLLKTHDSGKEVRHHLIDNLFVLQSFAGCANRALVYYLSIELLHELLHPVNLLESHLWEQLGMRSRGDPVRERLLPRRPTMHPLRPPAETSP